MSFYLIGCETIESVVNHILEHPENMSEEAFESVIMEAYRPIFIEAIEQNVFRGKMEGHRNVNLEPDTSEFIQAMFEMDISSVVSNLVENFGFKYVEEAYPQGDYIYGAVRIPRNIKYAQEYRIFGWGNLFNEEKGFYGIRKDQREQRLADFAASILKKYKSESGHKLYSLKYKTPFILVYGPSGCGKTTLVKEFCKNRDDAYKVLTCTSRPPRDGEKDLFDYEFVSGDDILLDVSEGTSIGLCEYDNYLYAVPYKNMNLKLSGFDVEFADDKVPILILETSGVKEFLDIYPNSVAVYIESPDIAKLREKRDDYAGKRDALLEDPSLAHKIIVNQLEAPQIALAELEKIVEEIKSQGISRDAIE